MPGQCEHPDLQYVMFTDGDLATPCQPWEIRSLSPLMSGMTTYPLQAMWHRWSTEKCLGGATRYALWIDGNRRLKCYPEWMMDVLSDPVSAVFVHHPTRRCCYDEAIEHCRLRIDSGLALESIGDMARNHYQADRGLVMTNIILMDLHSKAFAGARAEILDRCGRLSYRDQIHTSFVLNRRGVDYASAPPSLEHELTESFAHARDLR